MRLLAFISQSFQKADRLVRGFNAVIYVLSSLVWGGIYLALNSSWASMWGEAHICCMLNIQHLGFLLKKKKVNNICFSPLLWSGKAINFILRKEGGNRKSHHTTHFHYQTLGNVTGNQKGTVLILQFYRTKHYASPTQWPPEREIKINFN